MDPTSRYLPPFFAYVFPFWWVLRLAYRYVNTLFSDRFFRARVPRPVLDGLLFAEGPRIHDDKLYVSDMVDQTVLIIDLHPTEHDHVAPQVYDRIKFSDHVSGLGFLPDNRLLVVLMNSRSLILYNLQQKTYHPYADLAALSRVACNDMVVDKLGRAYVGNFGYHISDGISKMRGTTLALVVPPNPLSSFPSTPPRVLPVARDLGFPNGSVLTPDGRTLIIAETLGGRLTCFDVSPTTGSLTNRRVWANVGVPVDGICLDSQGCIWAAVPFVSMHRWRGGAIRVDPHGRIVDMIGFHSDGLDRGVIACMLYTTPRQTHQLLLCVARNLSDTALHVGRANSKIVAFDVPVGPARIPGDLRYNAGYW